MMALPRYTVPVDGTIPVHALLYTNEQLLATQEGVGIYDGYAHPPHAVHNPMTDAAVPTNLRLTNQAPSLSRPIDFSTWTQRRRKRAHLCLISHMSPRPTIMLVSSLPRPRSPCTWHAKATGSSLSKTATRAQAFGNATSAETKTDMHQIAVPRAHSFVSFAASSVLLQHSHLRHSTFLYLFLPALSSRHPP